MFSKDLLAAETRIEFKKIKEIEQKINRDDLTFKTGSKKRDRTNGFQKVKFIVK